MDVWVFAPPLTAQGTRPVGGTTMNNMTRLLWKAAALMTGFLFGNNVAHVLYNTFFRTPETRPQLNKPEHPCN